MTISPPARGHSPRDVEARTHTPVDKALGSVLDATRGLLWVDSPDDAAALATGLVIALGGTVVAAREAPADAVPIDLSFGAGDPLLPLVPPRGRARILVERHLPGFVRDAQRALELMDRPRRLAEEASVDALTGLANRRLIGRALGRLVVQHTVVMIDLDHFRSVNDTFGHEEGDRVLRELGAALRATGRAIDRVGRYGGEEFVALLADGDPEAFLLRLRQEWELRRPRPVTFSAGIAPADLDVVHVLAAADRALSRAKAAGRDQWQWALAADYR